METERKELNLDLNVKEVIAEMSEGNPGALTTMMKLYQSGMDYCIAGLYLMNMRGPQIWVAYKYWAEFDLEKLSKGIMERDQAMIDFVNDQMGEDYPHKATQRYYGV